MQVVRSRPDVHEHQRPEVQDRQAIAEDRPFGGLRHEVVHQAEERRREEEGDGVVAIPPLHERILHAGIQAVALERPGGDREVVEDVQDGDGDDRRQVEPERHVEVALASANERADEVDREDHPDDGDHDVDRPLQLGVLLGLGKAEGERDGGGDDDELPPPEVRGAQSVGVHARLAQALRGVVDAGEDRVAGEGEDDGVGVERAQAPERQERGEIGVGPRHLDGDDHAHQHAHDPPQDGREQEFPDDGVIVTERLEPHGRGGGRVGGDAPSFAHAGPRQGAMKRRCRHRVARAPRMTNSFVSSEMSTFITCCPVGAAPFPRRGNPDADG